MSALPPFTKATPNKTHQPNSPSYTKSTMLPYSLATPLALPRPTWRISVFYLLRPGEYCLSPDSTPFRICDVQLRIGHIVLNITTCSFDTLNRATCTQLEFTDQKYMFHGEVLAHGRSGHYLTCPVAALVVRPLLHLRSHGCTPLTPLYHVYPLIFFLIIFLTQKFLKKLYVCTGTMFSFILSLVVGWRRS
jgi:hypothetical protein